MSQKLSSKAKAAKAKRDLAYAKSPRRTRMKAECQKARRSALKRGKNISGKDYSIRKAAVAKVPL